MSLIPPWLEKILTFSCLKCPSNVVNCKKSDFPPPRQKSENSNSFPKPFLPRHFEKWLPTPDRTLWKILERNDTKINEIEYRIALFFSIRIFHQVLFWTKFLKVFCVELASFISSVFYVGDFIISVGGVWFELIVFFYLSTIREVYSLTILTEYFIFDLCTFGNNAVGKPISCYSFVYEFYGCKVIFVDKIRWLLLSLYLWAA